MPTSVQQVDLSGPDSLHGLAAGPQISHSHPHEPGVICRHPDRHVQHPINTSSALQPGESDTTAHGKATIRTIPQSPIESHHSHGNLESLDRKFLDVIEQPASGRPTIRHRPRTSPAAQSTEIERPDINIPQLLRPQNVRLTPRTTSVGKTNKLYNTISLDRLNERLVAYEPESTMDTLTLEEPARQSVHMRTDHEKKEVYDAIGQLQEQGRDLIAVPDDWDRAQLIYDGKALMIAKDQLAGWLGDNDQLSARTLTIYMKLFNFSALNILAALRVLCSKLILRGETQQVDRILSAFSERWGECNSQHGFFNADIVHTLCYSIILLNTDLHVADIPFSQKMTRNQFVKNTLATVRAVRMRIESPDLAVEPESASAQGDLTSAGPSAVRLPPSSFTSAALEGPVAEGRSSMDSVRSTRRQSQLPLPDCGPLVTSPFVGNIKLWEAQIDKILRDFYNSIRSSALPLHDSGTADEAGNEAQDPARPSHRSQAPLKRTVSVLSKSASESGQLSTKLNAQNLGSRWIQRYRTRPRLYPMSTGGSSRTSFDEQDSPMWSPNDSSTWSKQSLVKSGTSVSVDSFGSQVQMPAYGFASSLSNAMQRDESALPSGDGTSPGLVEDRLELAGAPWAKEGLLKHKHHMEASNKKAKHRAWTECFVVVQRGWLRLFSFPNKSSTIRSANDGVVGGGNWLQNAKPIDSFVLRHTFASIIPHGASKDRPHTWALNLNNGATHLFQAGTEEIAREFVVTTNYWSARSSREPLAGGISNAEYGWSCAALKPTEVPVRATAEMRPSDSSSSRQSQEPSAARPGDSIMISEWTPPSQSTLSSNLSEIEQLTSLKKHTEALAHEMSQHKENRVNMVSYYSPRHPNLIKALTNWERRNGYLMRERNKQMMYIDSIEQAISEKRKLEGEQAETTKKAEGEIEKQ